MKKDKEKKKSITERYNDLVEGYKELLNKRTSQLPSNFKELGKEYADDFLEDLLNIADFFIGFAERMEELDNTEVLDAADLEEVK